MLQLSPESTLVAPNPLFCPDGVAVEVSSKSEGSPNPLACSVTVIPVLVGTHYNRAIEV
jgi:hypothetical protein